MQAIEKEFIIPADGKLPEAFREFFGRKARVIVLSAETNKAFSEKDKGTSERLMEFAGTIDWPIDDAVEWQRRQRSEWEREWDR